MSRRPGRPPKTPQAPAMREAILDAASALFVEHGIGSTSTRSIADKVGIRQASLYHHFANRDALIEAVLERSVAPTLELGHRIIEQLRADPDADILAALTTFITADASLILSEHNTAILYLSPDIRAPQFHSFRTHRAQVRGMYRDLIDAALASHRHSSHKKTLRPSQQADGTPTDAAPALPTAPATENIATYAFYLVESLASRRVDDPEGYAKGCASITQSITVDETATEAIGVHPWATSVAAMVLYLIDSAT